MQYDPCSKTNHYIIDSVVIGVSFLLAYQIRFEGRIPPESAFQMWLLLPVVMAGRLAVNIAFRVHRQIWRYVSINDTFRIAQSYAAFSVALLVLRLELPDRWALLRLPLSIIAMEFLFSLFAALSARMLRRIIYQWQSHWGLGTQARKRVVLVGAGSAGVMAAKELSLRPDVKILGFLDDNPKKHGAVIGGISVLGPSTHLGELAHELSIDEVILCITRAPAATLKRLWQLCEGIHARTLIVPALDEIFDREVGINRLREVKMEDLLGRETVEPSPALSHVAVAFRDKRILVTGAGGSIGSELVRQLAGLEPACLLLLDKDENTLYERQLELEARIPKVPFEILVGDIRFGQRLQKIFERYRPEIVFHAAAHKQVPLMELNPAEAILNNVFGTYDLVELAIAFEAARFVFISTDKAVKPASIMGASKRLAELVIQSRIGRHKTHFSCVRFGNVMASRGSVIPLFQKQIAAGGPVTLTHPEMRRFFMIIPEAVQLVIQAGAFDGNGAIYVLDMGEPIRIADLARDLVEFSGLRPNQDIQIETVGLRPGEKLSEELVGDGEYLTPGPARKVFLVKNHARLDLEQFENLLSCLRKAAEENDVVQIHKLLHHFKIGFNLFVKGSNTRSYAEVKS